MTGRSSEIAGEASLVGELVGEVAGVLSGEAVDVASCFSVSETSKGILC